MNLNFIGFFIGLIGMIQFHEITGLEINKYIYDYLFDSNPAEYLSNANPNIKQTDFNIDSIKKSMLDSISIEKKQIEKEKYKTVLEKEEKLKEEPHKIAKANIIKQLEIDNENKNLEKYYKLMKQNLRREIDENDEELLIKIVEEKLNCQTE